MNPAIEFDVSRLSDKEIGQLAVYAQTRMFRTSPYLATWLLSLIADEGVRREETPQQLPQCHHRLPDDWPNPVVSDALVAVTAISFAEGVSQTVGELVDKITIHVSALAASRLRASVTVVTGVN